MFLSKKRPQRSSKTQPQAGVIYRKTDIPKGGRSLTAKRSANAFTDFISLFIPPDSFRCPCKYCNIYTCMCQCFLKNMTKNSYFLSRFAHFLIFFKFCAQMYVQICEFTRYFTSMRFTRSNQPRNHNSLSNPTPMVEFASITMPSIRPSCNQRSAVSH